MTEYESVHGSIVHIEFNTEDVDAASDFFEEVFDWTVEEQADMDGYEGYLSWRAPNPPSGGIMAPNEGPFSPPTTVFYVNVEDIEETNKAIVEAGGEILVETMEVSEMGVFTVFQDPGGVVNAVWEDRYDGEPPEGGWPMFTDDAEVGSIVHFELYTDDPAATQSFYEAVFGWEFEEVEGDYVMAHPPTPPYGGIMEANDEMPVGTLLYILVDDAKDVITEIEEAYGEVLREPFDIDKWGTMAVFAAPGGVVLALWESTQESMDAGEAQPHAA